MPFAKCQMRLDQSSNGSDEVLLKSEMANGIWQMANGKSEMANGKWQMARTKSPQI